MIETKGLNQNQLKYLAVFAMILDHIAVFFVSPNSALYILFKTIGRLTAPIMCYFIAEGYYYTSSKKKYGLRLFIFAVISQFAYALGFHRTLLVLDFNVIFTLFLSFMVLLSYDRIKNVVLKWVTVVFIIALSYWCDWGIYGPLWVLFFYIFRGKKVQQAVFFIIISLLFICEKIIVCVIKGAVWFNTLCHLGLLLFVPLIFIYSGKRGKKNLFNKWAFYIIYPLHIAVFALIAFLI